MAKQKEDSDKKSISDYMDLSREKLSGICTANVVCDGHPDRLCMGLKYGAPLGFGGAGQGKTFYNNFLALQKYKFRMRVIRKHHEPEIETSLFGQKLTMPILVTSISGVKISMNDSMPEDKFQQAMIEGALKAGTIGLSGNTVDHPNHPGIEVIGKNKGIGIPVFKPQEQKKLIELFKRAEKAGCIAIGLDLDGAGSTNWALRGKPLYRKSEEELKELIKSVKVPVLLKGIMTLEDAETAYECGAKAIDISNHGGRILDDGQGVADVLPEIAKRLKGKIIIMADGAVRSGFDALKLLALGADFVLVGRPLARMALAGGADAVAQHLDYYRKDLKAGMLMTCCDNLKEINDKILVKEK